MMRKINFAKLLLFSLITLMILMFMCVVGFIVLLGQSFYEILTIGVPVEEQYILSNEVLDYYSEHCDVKREELRVSYPNQIPRHGLNFYNTRSGGYFHELIKVDIKHNDKKESLDIKFKIYVSEDNVTIEEVNGVPSDSFECPK